MTQAFLSRTLFAASAAFMVTAPSASAQLLDDFNRADASTLGAQWTQQSGTSSIVSNRATGISLALATFVGGSGNVVSFDLFIGGGGSQQYGAGVLGFGTGDNYFVKVQSSNSGTAFGHYGFYRANNNSAGGVFGILSNSFTSARVTVTRTGTLATLDIVPNVGDAQSYSFDYGYAPTGTGIGLGFFGTSTIDNFGGTANVVPEPSTYALLAAGLTAIGLARRRRTTTMA